jgi:putative two-component system response regulator
MEKQTILVVDDVPENIDILKGILQSRYKIKVALNGEKALAIVATSPPDLILLDIMMPGMDGYEVCRRIKNETATRNIPIIFVTAKNEKTDEVEGLELGAVDYLRKPVVPVLVIARVKTHLALYDQNRALEEKVRQRTAELESTRLEIIRRLGRASEFKDNETGLHVIRMSYYSAHIARKAGMAEDEVEMILNASPMHDVGKIGIPDNIILKPGKLDDDEWQIMRSHPQIGADIIGEHPVGILRLAREIALSHHEKWDGRGYPAGLAGENIPYSGRIVAIADVFDALTTERPYKKAWPIEKALNVIQEEKGHHFDPDLVDVFLGCIDDLLKVRDKYQEKF